MNIHNEKPKNSVTMADIFAKIIKSEYVVLGDGRTTICQLTLRNGYTVLGQSSCVDPNNFNKALGEKYAYEDAVNKIWPLEGYLLMEQREQSENAAWQKMDFIARVCHEVNRAYCESLGDMSQPSWEDAPSWQRESARMGVDLHMMGDFGPEASHESWMAQKYHDGWVHGDEKDPVAKTHPCMVPFDKLPREQQAKDFIFRAVVHSLRHI